MVVGLEYTCADASGNSNTATNAKTPPTVVVTAPGAGTLPPGAVAMTATCTDISGTTCTQVCYLVDNIQVSASCPTTAPYTFSWDSTKIIDGAHTITAIGFNVASTPGTSSGVSITTANGISAKTVWLNSSTGNDSNNCLSSGTACLTLAHIRSAITFLGGDTFNLIGTFTEIDGFSTVRTSWRLRHTEFLSLCRHVDRHHYGQHLQSIQRNNDRLRNYQPNSGR